MRMRTFTCVAVRCASRKHVLRSARSADPTGCRPCAKALATFRQVVGTPLRRRPPSTPIVLSPIRPHVVCYALVFCLALLGLPLAHAATRTQPNVILILGDDLGWTDLSCYGSELYETPHLDRLARDGVKFTQAYSACTVCSPTRAALLTGKYPARLHVTDWIPGLPPENPKLLVPEWTKYLPLEEVTIARALRSAGYATASIGKWHLGNEEHFPEKHGFDINLGGGPAPAPPNYFAPYKIATLPDGPEGEYLTDRLGEEAVRFIERQKDKPFFLYLPHFAVHTPIRGKEALVQKYRAKKRAGLRQTNAVYAAMIESMDDSIGRIRRKLEELKLSEQTIVIFTSDNGGRVPTTSNHPLRVGKGSCHEGGTRVPLIVHWPGVTKAGSVCEVPVISMDLYPTILEIAGVPEAARKSVDGVNLVSLLREGSAPKRDALFWHYPHYQHYQLGGTTPYGAIRAGDFKLIEFYDDMRVELYNLRDDIGEERNLATQMPTKADELRARLHAWRKDVGAQMPTRNPKYDPSKPEHDPATRRRQPTAGG
jgi:arylsulfatase A